MTATELSIATGEPAGEAPQEGAATAEALIEILFETSSHSESLMATRHIARVGGCEIEIPKFMLLGERGAGKPMRVGLFAGLEDHGSLDGIAAITRLLLQAELNPALVRDFALFAYPLVNAFEYREPVGGLESFDRRFARERVDEDVRFFHSELRKWQFHGMLTLRTDPRASVFRATVRSQLLASEVVRPALERVQRAAPVSSRPIKVRPGDLGTRLAEYADGRLTPPPEVRPYPFEVELFAPGAAPQELRIGGLFVAAHEILVNYRRLLSHAANI
jgi:hypothetical protein